jgi:hypothetical protein
MEDLFVRLGRAARVLCFYRCMHFRLSAHGAKSNSTRWSKFHPLYDVIGGGVKIFPSLKHNLLQQFPYFPSQLVGLTMPHHYLLYKVSGSH